MVCSNVYALVESTGGGSHDIALFDKDGIQQDIVVTLFRNPNTLVSTTGVAHFDIDSKGKIFSVGSLSDFYDPIENNAIIKLKQNLSDAPGVIWFNLDEAFYSSIGLGTGNSNAESPGITIDSEDNVYILSRHNTAATEVALIKIDKNANFLQMWTITAAIGLRTTAMLLTERDNIIYFGQEAGFEIRKFEPGVDADSSILVDVSAISPFGTTNTQIMALESGLFVPISAAPNSTTFQLSYAGALIQSIVSAQVAGIDTTPHGITEANPEGYIWISDAYSSGGLFHSVLRKYEITTGTLISESADLTQQGTTQDYMYQLVSCGRDRDRGQGGWISSTLIGAN